MGRSEDMVAPENPGNCIFDMSRSERASVVSDNILAKMRRSGNCLLV